MAKNVTYILLLFYFYLHCGISAWHHHPFIQSTHGHGYQSPLLFFLLDKVNVQQVSFNLAIFLRTKRNERAVGNKRTLAIMMGDQKIQDSAKRHLSSSMAVGHIEATPKICCSISFLTVIYVYQQRPTAAVFRPMHSINRRCYFFLTCTAGGFSRYFLAVFSRTRHLL